VLAPVAQFAADARRKAAMIAVEPGARLSELFARALACKLRAAVAIALMINVTACGARSGLLTIEPGNIDAGRAGGGAGGAPGAGGADGVPDASSPAESTPASCLGLAQDCGPVSDESCCATREVTGGVFYRSYDGVNYTDTSFPAKVSDFRLDRFEVTVGRFRKFVAAWNGGWRPEAGSGKHTSLNGGLGLSDSGDLARYEGGWDNSWADNVLLTDTTLGCDGFGQVWTPAPGANENLPIECANWYAAYAFCIWDGAMLPSEAEWNYAASGGQEQRVFSWSKPPASTQISCDDVTAWDCTHSLSKPVGSRSPAGDGRFGQADLAGNLWEWTLDWYSAYENPCSDCTQLTPSASRTIRGGSDDNTLQGLYLVAGFRESVYAAVPASTASSQVGVRCARGR
jgi:sulfatase modifying factor 1